MEIADCLKSVCESLRLLDAGEKDQIMDFPYFAVLFIYGADFAGKQESRSALSSRDVIRFPVLVFQYVKAFFCRDKLFGELLAPGGMGEIPRSDQVEPLPPRPQIKALGHAFLACCSGIFGVYMKICNKHMYTCTLLICYIIP